jgi:hypothetical protein
MRILLVALLAQLFFTSFSYARGVDVALSEETAYFRYMYDSRSIGLGGADMSTGFFYTENEDFLGTLDFLVTSSVVGTGKRVQLGAAAKAYLGSIKAEPDDFTTANIAIGIRGAYIFPSSTPMGFYGQVNYAPDITSFSDSENLTEIILGFEVEVAPSARFYIGYREIEAEFADFDEEVELDDEGHIGLNLTF